MSVKVTDMTIKSIVQQMYEQNRKVIDVSDLDTSECTSLHGVFANMDELEEIRGLNSLDLSNIVDMDIAFADCHSLKQIDLSNVDLHSAVHVISMCQNCYSLKRLSLSNCNLRNIVNMSNLCYNCPLLEELDLSHNSFDRLVTATFMHERCGSLITMKIDDIRLLNYTMFMIERNYHHIC